ncbi:hypothetical protein D3C87_1730660 [compost metagenome]
MAGGTGYGIGAGQYLVIKQHPAQLYTFFGQCVVGREIRCRKVSVCQGIRFICRILSVLGTSIHRYDEGRQKDEQQYFKLIHF